MTVNIIQRIASLFRRETRDGITFNDLKLASAIQGLPSASGVPVNPDTVLSHSAYWRGINLIANSTAKPNLIVYRRQARGKIEATTHPAFRLLKGYASPLYSASTFRKVMTHHALIYGTAYAWIRRDSLARPIELVILDPAQTRLIIEQQALARTTRMLVETRSATGGTLLIPWQDCLIIKGLSRDAFTGIPVYQILKDTIGEGLTYQRYSLVYFKNNGKPSIVLKVSGQLDDPDIDRLKRTWGEAHQGVDNAHKPAIIEEGTDLIQLQGSNESAQLDALRQFNLVSIANVLCLPAFLLGSNIATSYRSLEEFFKSYLAHSIDPWLVEWESETSLKLLSEQEKTSGSHYIEATREALIQTDLTTTINTLTTQISNGLLSRNEARAILNLDAIEEGQADEYTYPANLVFMGDEVVEVGETPTDEVAPTDVQAAALNGAQITSLVQILQAAALGQLPIESVKPMIQASFPLIPESLIDQIVEPLAVLPDSQADSQEETQPDDSQPDDSQDEDSQEDSQDEGDSRTGAILDSLAARVIARLERSMDAKSKRQDWQAWLTQDFRETHRQAIVDMLQPATARAEEITDTLLSSLQEELSAITRDQIPNIWHRYLQLLREAI